MTLGIPVAQASTPSTTSGYWCAGYDPTTIMYGQSHGLFSSRAITLSYVGFDMVCHTPDPAIHAAIERGVGEGSLACSEARATESGNDTFHWDNGRTSVLTYLDTIRPGLSITTGTITAGEFEGAEVHAVGAALPLDPGVCTNPSAGVSKGLFVGESQFLIAPRRQAG